MNTLRALRFAMPVLAGLIAGAWVEPARAADNVFAARAVSGFDKIRLEGAFKTAITVGPGKTRVVVSGSRDAVDRVTTEVKDHTLVVGMRSGTNLFNRAPALTISLPALRSFSNQGAGSANIAGLTGGDVAIENDGAASITASGRAAHATISLNGTGKIDTTAVDARDVTVDNNGFGSVRIRASGTVTASVNGVGDIRYTGNPAHVQTQINGVGHIGPL